MDRKKKKGKIRCVLLILCAIAGGTGLLVWLRKDVPAAASVGIIGGADGPTAVFVTTSVNPAYLLALTALVLIALWGCWRFFKRR